MRKEDVEYTLYLVTDTALATQGGQRSLYDVVEAALQGGVTIVQYRDKTSDQETLIETAKQLHALTRKHKVPLLINDHVTVAKAIGCEGVHVGQDDMHIAQAREALGPDAIIGVSAGTAEEAIAACAAGADYLGIGAVYATPTKTNTNHILGVEGLSHILHAIGNAGYGNIPTVCIGGINASNAVKTVVHSALDWGNRLSSAKVVHENPVSGVAVVSAIMAHPNPRQQAEELYKALQCLSATAIKYTGALREFWERRKLWERRHDNTYLKEAVPRILRKFLSAPPIVHNMTNTVVQNFVANVLLSINASPIMAPYGGEAADLAKLGGALVVNIGTLTPESVENQVTALKAYNAAGRPVIFDPVGAGASDFRRNAVKAILNAGQLTVIKGNPAELEALASLVPALEGQIQSSGVQQRGVDGTSQVAQSNWQNLVTSLAVALNTTVIMTGPVDAVSDGKRTVAVFHGHEYLGRVTGTGCAAGAVVAAMVSVWPDDTLAAAVTGLQLFEVAAERAAKRDDVKGPGTFAVAFLDELNSCKTEAGQGVEWWGQWKIENMSDP